MYLESGKGKFKDSRSCCGAANRKWYNPNAKAGDNHSVVGEAFLTCTNHPKQQQQQQQQRRRSVVAH